MKKYQEIYNDLKEKIRTNVYPAETSLPTEQQLQEMYNVSRDTVRKALAILTERGMIQKVQGRGSLVLKQELLNFPVSGLTSYQELSDALQLKSVTEVIDLELVTVNSNLSQLTGFEPFSKVWKIVRTRSIDGKVSVVDTDYLSAAIVHFMDKETAKGSIYDYLENTLELDIAYAQKEITVEPTSWEERELMQTQDDYLVLIKSRVYLSDTQQFQYTESKHKIDKFRFVDFARRKRSL
ncbi:trehalose operon repressor [Streptococcus suis]|uniref:trehalose operon repressor n=1 Tax=Streptococcus suis TaxID=1307 RepID=UPI0003FB4E5C|nr:trehalose operon repressor [Streptococcus suis]BCP58476.1 trehalose operon repressor [Streptococcus parasuis]MBY5011065.1 trehalose operon repressor [Streptococcus suis]MDG4514910.1 trehalose operon repressor [Streptococcus suis]MDG4519456.1 trehalose operon repressor [Streptococcus suis]NQI73174.1 trehalose operon repressor [Streptococcus suis]